MKNENQEIKFPTQEIKNLWPTIYKKIVDIVKDKHIYDELSFEENVRHVLRSHLDMNLVKTDDAHRNFFKDTLRFAINMHTDKILYRIESGRNHYRVTGVKRDNSRKT